MFKKERTALRFALSSGNYIPNQNVMIPFQLTRMLFFRKSEDALWNEARVSKAMTLQIDGFPGSANSFLTRYLRASLDEGTLIGNHFHSPVEFLAGYQMGLPSLFLIREPKGAINSWVRRWKGIPLEDAFEHYVTFHRAMQSLPEEALICDFSYSIKRPHELLSKMAERYDFPIREDLPSDFSKFEPRNEARKKGEDPETIELAERIEGMKNEPKVLECEQLYQSFLQRSQTLQL